MAALSAILPRPVHTPLVVDDEEDMEMQTSTVVAQTSRVPPYGQRKGWRPGPDDFGDGGAFPECHVAQYPLGMGKKKASAGNTLALTVDAEGNVRYDAIAKQGHDQDRIVQSQFKDLVPLAHRKDLDEDAKTMDRPSAEEIDATTERTRLALEKLVNTKIKAAQPKNVPESGGNSSFVRYTPGQQGSGGGGLNQRIIKITEVAEDPLEPPKFKHKKIPKGPPSPPAPVLRSPPRKATAQEQKDWMIPPCISNWKNNKGYTIPLDKRLAADGRGLQDIHINDNFAKFSEALYIADRHAREEVRQRTLMQQKLAEKEKASKEENLRMLAQRAREGRTGVATTAKPTTAANAAFKSSLGQQQHRDISEKVALGLAKPTMTKESMIDQRLFNRESLSGSFADDDAYNLYDKPLFHGSTAAAAIYKARGNISQGNEESFGGGTEDGITKALDNDRFGLGTAGKFGFEGASEQEIREGPVQFEKDNADVFGVDQFLDQAKRGQKRGLDTDVDGARKRRQVENADRD
ncbi:mRNA splicing protein [Serendipita sp. 398]|nr:mRNA splicing protein [Serendipita sp. 398]